MSSLPRRCYNPSGDFDPISITHLLSLDSTSSIMFFSPKSLKRRIKNREIEEVEDGLKDEADDLTFFSSTLFVLDQWWLRKEIERGDEEDDHRFRSLHMTIDREKVFSWRRFYPLITCGTSQSHSRRVNGLVPFVFNFLCWLFKGLVIRGLFSFITDSASTRHPSFTAVSKSFLDLLNNQQQNTQPSVQLSPANVSFDGTQWAEDATLEAHIVEDRKERRKWTPTEDLVLISAWLNTSKDPVVSNEQKAIAFWKRVAAYVAGSPKLAGMQKRERTHCKQRRGKINEGVCKFVGCYEAATKEKSSGQNDSDVMKMAHAIFFNDYKVKFTLEHAWLELRHDQKWCRASTTKDKVQSKRRKLDDQSAQSSTSVPGEDDHSARPSRVKATKAKAKKSVSKPTLEGEGKEFHSLWEIRQQDFALKDKLNKHKLLDSLIAKTEPLSELEFALKNQLIKDMLA
ncbi:hypothetical protein YC2023_057434 [Brassica napus]